MAKRKTKQKQKTKKKKSSLDGYLKIVVLVLSFIAVSMIFAIGGYYLGYNNAKEEAQKTKIKKHHKNKTKKQKSKDENLNKELKTILKTTKIKHDITAAHEIEDNNALKPIENKTVIKNNKPKLAIIFDDISFASQIRAIKALKIPVTLSFFPPSNRHPNTAKLASKEKFYMIHLPMEAMNFHKEEPFTLRVDDSYETILNRITKIKKLFPRVKYINNHTGSKFTSDKDAVFKLIRALDKYDIKFIDSRTTSKTKVPVVMKRLGRKYVARDVFLDHNPDIDYIKKQIKEAVRLAKRYKTVIAIGHPHKNTIKALAESKNILKQVNLVYVYQIY
jgi:polysaccharide deacetylase 2 family uncharacterized protein YibQ